MQCDYSQPTTTQTIAFVSASVKDHDASLAKRFRYGIKSMLFKSVDFDDIVLIWLEVAVATQEEIEASDIGQRGVLQLQGREKAHTLCLVCDMMDGTLAVDQADATSASFKQETARVCHFNGLVISLLGPIVDSRRFTM
jgi:hypothetical protein